MCVLFRKTVIKYMIPKNMVPKNSTILQGFLVIFYFFYNELNMPKVCVKVDYLSLMKSGTTQAFTH